MRGDVTRAMLGALALAMAAGCKADAPTGAPAPAEPRPTAAAAADMCAEHGVLEALCTKCNPSLAPIFQKKGDWCGEHGLPESICPICHPERGGRPAVDVSVDEAPPDGLEVRLAAAETARIAGLDTAPVIERAVAGTLVAPARLTWDATRLARIGARSSGVVRSLAADVGAVVAADAPLATVDSPEVGATRGERAAASARLTAARKVLARERDLHARGLSPLADVQRAEAAVAVARAELAASRASLSATAGAGGKDGRYALTTPIAGTVTQRLATIGQTVNAGEVLFEIVDTSVVWAEVDVPERDIGRLAVGQAVTITVPALGPDARFQGTVAVLGAAVDEHTRTVRVRVPLDNPDGRLRANMLAEARVEAAAGAPALLVPRAAVQNAKGVELVFVKKDVDLYQTRRVRVGAYEGDLVRITSGLKPGEQVVTTGSFLLKTETLRDSIGAGCCAED